ncbi:hypothetical protein F4561_006115 [Lipingzhangella halophila]|uniref:Uncharacterized protein n=1 Tax=Lipingzhangella halophila TaxID=1783352 RepID=A0A7W7W603_9ACTN|nr:hypothetical protein [Lipingzhangella halophila]MBB4935221.1 hypothetical protein [Lipingzhangella halophila]
MNAGTDTATPNTQHDSGEPAGSRYRLAGQAKRLAGSHAATLARLDAFEDTLRTPVPVTAPEPSARNPNRPVPVSPRPTPMPGFSGDGRGLEAAPRRPNPSPDDRRVGAVAPLLTLLLGVLLSWTGADLLRPMVEGTPLWRAVLHVPGILLVLALLGAGAAVAAALAASRPHPPAPMPGKPEEPADQEPPVSRVRLTASLLLYLAVLGSIMLWAVLWVVAAVPVAAPAGAMPALAGALLVGVVALAILPTQLRHARIAARAGREQGAPWDGGGAPPDFPPPPLLDAAAWWRSLRHQRRERRRRRMRDRARTAVVEHARAWEDVYHECQRHADTHDSDSAPARAVLRELGSVRPVAPEAEPDSVTVEFADPDLVGNMATIVRCLARYHPSVLEARFERVSRAFRAETGTRFESGAE